ncbi:MAG: RagB/SusD family nutrient uptake outer membrane protein [Dysgonamonadaceae bacterium]|jgi:hypothetical protein|nr:RagB/SusD family nutrient uptake outer membrane protein [Dysgonamonadaceae bacterium]
MQHRKNSFRYSLLLLIVGVLTSCVDIFNEKLLEQTPEQDLDFEKVFSDYEQFRKYADYTYTYMPCHLGRMWNSLNCAISDEAEGLGLNNCSTVFNNGAWSGATVTVGSSIESNAALELGELWKKLYAGIRQANMALDNMDRIQNYPSATVKERIRGELYFIRAYLYFELIKRWGGVPVFDKSLNINNDVLDKPRDSYDQCVQFITADCDRAAAILAPIENIENGRATQGAALALKSRTLLYAARKLNNPDERVEKWQAAAAAAKAVIDLQKYSLHGDYVNLFFEPVCNEIILNRPRPAMNFEQGHTDNSNFLVRFIVPEGYNGWMGTGVTQNLVDMFEDNRGYPIHDAGSNYNPDKPYENRDPRFKMTILYNDRTWHDRKMEFYRNGRDYGSNYTNPLGYGIAKFWKESHQRYQRTTTYLNYIVFRYAEILLNFAEAQNEAGGPESNLEGLSVRDALSQVRGRVGQVPVPVAVSGTKEAMRERIKNERAVELCFEEQRWYDVISWHEGVKYFDSTIRGMKIEKEGNKFTYEIYDYEKRIFKEHMHRYPIPNEEIYKSQYLEQNPGW